MRSRRRTVGGAREHLVAVRRVEGQRPDAARVVVDDAAEHPVHGAPHPHLVSRLYFMQCFCALFSIVGTDQRKHGVAIE